MLDLNLMLESMLTLNPQGNFEKINQVDLIDNTDTDDTLCVTDACTFMWLLSQVANEEPVVQEAVECIEKNSEKALDSEHTKSALDFFEENLAITWIESPLYCSPAEDSLLEKKSVDETVALELKTEQSTLVGLAQDAIQSDWPAVSLNPQIAAIATDYSFLDGDGEKNTGNFFEDISVPLDLTLAVSDANGAKVIDTSPHSPIDASRQLLEEKKESATSFSSNTMKLSQPDEPPKDSVLEVGGFREGEREVSADFVNDANKIESRFLEPVLRSTNELTSPDVIRQKIDASDRHSSFQMPMSLDTEHPQWTGKLTEQIIWLGQQDIKKAIIQVHPEELGPLAIQVHVDNEIASVNISSMNQQLREIVDNSLPVLQEMLSKQGLDLGHVQVDVGTFSHSQEPNQPVWGERLSEEEEDGVQVSPLNLAKSRHKGQVDYFA